jgi:transcriptional regulator with XRE-family HTH domain
MGKHMSLANRLKELRRAIGWTQQDLSRASGLTRSYISRLEMGDIALPSSEKLRALAHSLSTSPDDLLQAAGYIDNPAEATELPDLKIYLRRKYGMQEARTLQALETIITGLHSAPQGGQKGAGRSLNGISSGQEPPEDQGAGGGGNRQGKGTARRGRDRGVSRSQE